MRASAATSAALDPTQTGREARNLENTLRRLIVGQDEAIQHIVNIYQMYTTGMAPPNRPIGNFLFLGPTGSGKTRIVEATAMALVNNSKGVVKVDCAEFQHSHEIAKLIGSPPGYLGHRETHALLSQDVLNQCHSETVKVSFVLFDEIEKASDALWNLLLGIMDKGVLTLGDNRKVDFSRSMIFLTSNLGAAEMNALISPKLGFPAAAQGAERPDLRSPKMERKVQTSALEAARRKFTPEFMNRLDKVVVFRPLAEEQLRQVLDIELQFVQQRVFHSSTADRCFVFSLTEPAKNHLLSEGIDPRYGARHLKRAIERLLVQPLSNLMATHQVKGGDWLKVDFDTGRDAITFHREAESLPYHVMAEIANTTNLLGLNDFTRQDHVRHQSARSGRRS